jgi:hypothetical protein
MGGRRFVAGAGFDELCTSVDVPIFMRLALNRRAGSIASGHTSGRPEWSSYAELWCHREGVATSMLSVAWGSAPGKYATT